ncbi:MAG: hypothetical protein J6X30_03505, partial [Clostridia bacterium]|nr:hypothetical protein [Clostridia bacterium]
GGIVGYAENSALSSCRTTGMLTASGGSTGMYAACGGLAGVLSALSNKTSSLSGCASSASLSGHCAGKGAAGGLVGYAISRRGISYITIESSYAAATQSVVAGNTLFSGGLLGTYFIPAARAANGSRLFIQNCFALTDSTVSAPTLFKGGLLGKHAYSASAIENAYYFNLSGEALSAVSSSECYGSLDHVYAPESFVDAAEPDYFEGFDFSSVWRITGEYLYPQLSAVAFDEQLLSPASGTLTVTGSALEGETLTASFDAPARFTWFADEELRAQGKTYTVTDADFGHTLTVQARPYGLVRGTVVSDPVSVTFIACLSSSAYRLGEDMISQIAPQPSVSAFVSALQGLPVAYRVQYAGESLSDDAVIPSRAELVFSDSAGEHTFTLYVRGDLNDDGLSDASDARILRQFLLTGQNAPPLACADFNDDGKIDVKDSVLLKQAQ